MKSRRPDSSIADTVCGTSRPTTADRPAARPASDSQSATSAAKSTSLSFARTGSGARKLTSMKRPRLSAIRFWLAGMIAVCGIGRPSGRLNSATTAYQSARPPMVAASAKAATKPSHGQRGCNERAVANSATHRQSAGVAKNLVRLSAAQLRHVLRVGREACDGGGSRIGWHGNTHRLPVEEGMATGGVPVACARGSTLFASWHAALFAVRLPGLSNETSALAAMRRTAPKFMLHCTMMTTI